MNLKQTSIAYLDLEYNPRSQQIVEYGVIWINQTYRGNDSKAFLAWIDAAEMLCGHNVLFHDLPILKSAGFGEERLNKPIVDTLLLSPLLFPKKPYHPLVKDYHLDGKALNNPLADARLVKDLLADLVTAFYNLDTSVQQVYWSLLKDIPGFDGFFMLIDRKLFLNNWSTEDLAGSIGKAFDGLICGKADLLNMIKTLPQELAYALAMIQVNDSHSLLPEWIRHQFPKTLGLVNQLRITCNGDGNCAYCKQLSPVHSLQRFFGFPSFRKFDGDGTIPLQERVVRAALDNQSFLALFPTGGGKSLTFQLPALMRGFANRALTVIISPLQSLMKDQVDVLENRHQITQAVTINGRLFPLPSRSRHRF